MFAFLRKLRNSNPVPQVVVPRPKHIRLEEFGSSMDKCLRNLERSAGLPAGDLYFKGEPMQVASFPSGDKYLRHNVGSRTSDVWVTDPLIEGYIAGDVLQPVEVNPSGNNRKFLGSLHISQNCPGVYRDNVCTTCGDSAP